MKRKTEYIIEEELARAIRKITGKINGNDFKEKYGLIDSEIKLVHEYCDLILMEEDE